MPIDKGPNPMKTFHAPWRVIRIIGEAEGYWIEGDFPEWEIVNRMKPSDVQFSLQRLYEHIHKDHTHVLDFLTVAWYLDSGYMQMFQIEDLLIDNARRNQLDTASVLLCRGADVNCVVHEGKGKTSSIDYAIRKGHQKMQQLLLYYGAKPSKGIAKSEWANSHLVLIQCLRAIPKDLVYSLAPFIR